jgi:hypothetical protein
MKEGKEKKVTDKRCYPQGKEKENGVDELPI